MIEETCVGCGKPTNVPTIGLTKRDRYTHRLTAYARIDLMDFSATPNNRLYFTGNTHLPFRNCNRVVCRICIRRFIFQLPLFTIGEQASGPSVLSNQWHQITGTDMNFNAFNCTAILWRQLLLQTRIQREENYYCRLKLSLLWCSSQLERCL